MRSKLLLALASLLHSPQATPAVLVSRVMIHVSRFVIRAFRLALETARTTAQTARIKILACLLPLLAVNSAQAAAGPVLANPILFVTQIPIPEDFTTIGSAFGSQSGSVGACGRGGDLWIRYPDGTLKNLTRAAGFGCSGDQSIKGIAVRQPCVYWTGTKALFSMVIGAPHPRYQVQEFYWQIYEITNFLDPAATPVITKIPSQPTNYNNISPIYGTDDKIIFSSDRPRNGDPALYPQLDEYEEAPTVTGLWSLDPVTGNLFMVNHTPSGAFWPSIDSFGRVIFTRWDHLQRDQQADEDNVSNGQTFGAFNYSDETGTALILTNNRTEIFPEPRYATNNLNAFSFNHFFPWQINEDGTAEETINHVGRHEIGGTYANVSFNDDPNLVALDVFTGHSANTIHNLLEMRESPITPGLFYGVDAPEFSTHAAGQLVTLTGATNINPDYMSISFLTPRSTDDDTNDVTPPPTDHTGLYRNPLPMSDGTLVCAHTSAKAADFDQGYVTTNDDSYPASLYDFRLKTLVLSNGFYVPGQLLTAGITNTATWYDPDALVTYSNTVLWELDPVEVCARTRPARRVETLDPIEQTIFAQEGVNIGDLQNYLVAHNLALIISRNLTTRDHADRQQPFNLSVPGGTETLGVKSGKIYGIQYFQLFQADQIRGLGIYQVGDTPRQGRRVLAQYLHDPVVDNPPLPAGPTGSVNIASDGSMAAFVPARRALTWQLTDPGSNSVVKERYWLTFQPGEMRTCTSCHGINEDDQSGKPTPTNSPAALRALLRYWKSQYVPVAQVQTNGGSNYLAIAFNRRLAATNLIYSVQVSSNLSTWLTGSIYTSSNSTPNTSCTTEVSHTGTNTQTIVVRDNTVIGTSKTRFMRVQVTSP